MEKTTYAEQVFITGPLKIIMVEKKKNKSLFDTGKTYGKTYEFFKKHRGILTAGTILGPTGVIGYLGYEQLKKLMNKKKK